jgi:hypothetical protein
MESGMELPDVPNIFKTDSIQEDYIDNPDNLKEHIDDKYSIDEARFMK